MPLIDEEALRRLRGEPKLPSSSRSYYTTADRWEAISRVMERLGARSLNKFLDEAVSIFLSVLDGEEERENVTRARARAAAQRPNVKRSHRSYYTADERWAAIDAAMERHEFRSSNAFLDTAVEYWLAFVEEELPKDFKPKPVTQETLRRVAGVSDTKKNGRK